MLGGRSPLEPEGFRRADIQALPPGPCFHGSGLCHSPGTAPLNNSPGDPASSQRTTKLKKMVGPSKHNQSKACPTDQNPLGLWGRGGAQICRKQSHP